MWKILTLKTNNVTYVACSGSGVLRSRYATAERLNATGYIVVCCLIAQGDVLGKVLLD